MRHHCLRVNREEGQSSLQHRAPGTPANPWLPHGRMLSLGRYECHEGGSNRHHVQGARGDMRLDMSAFAGV
jgi:hypothetical protein